MKRKWFYIFIFLPAFSSCLESPEMTTGKVNGKEKPTVRTVKTNPSPNDNGNLFFQGEVTYKGKTEIAERGFCWSTVSNVPDITDNVIKSDNSDIFTCELKGASGGEIIYYWRAYAKNSYGIEYGEVYTCETPKIWEPKERLNGNNRGKGAVFVLNNSIFMICGEYESAARTTVPENDAWEYNILTNRWDQMKDTQYFPGDERINPVDFTIGNSTFVGTGRVAKESEIIYHNDFYQYNGGISNSWTKITVPDDLEARYEAVAFSLNGKGYLVGGTSANGERLNDVWQYDPQNDSWEKKANFQYRLYGGISISDNNRAFVGMGNAPGTERILWEYNEETDNWDEFAILPADVKKTIDTRLSGVIVQNFIYIVDENNIIWTLNMNDETKTWNEKANLPTNLLNEEGKGGHQTLLTTGNSNSIYVGLGYSKYLYEYRPLWDN